MPPSRSSSRDERAETSVEAIPDIVSHTDPAQTDDLTLDDDPDSSIEVIGRVGPSSDMDTESPVDISGRVQSEAQAGPSEPEHLTPEVVAIPLPMVDEVEGQDERWFIYKMSWSGKIYDIDVGANDL